MKRKKVGLLLLTLLPCALMSCAMSADVRLREIRQVSPRAPQPEPAPPPKESPAPVIVAQPAPPPSISEPELRNLFARANYAYREIVFYDIEELLPEKTGEALGVFYNAKSRYDMEIQRQPFDGILAYPAAAPLEGAAAVLNALLDEGLPLRAEAAKKKAEAAARRASSYEGAAEAADRLESAGAELAAAGRAWARSDFRQAIASYESAALLYESAAAKADVELLRAIVFSQDIAENEAERVNRAEELRADDEALYGLADNASIEQGTEKLREAIHLYAQILDQRRRMPRAAEPPPPVAEPLPSPAAAEPPPPAVDKSKEEALARLADARAERDKAKQRNAAFNYPEEWTSGLKLLAETEKAFEKGDYNKARSGADASVALFAAIPQFAVLPARYAVRLIPSLRDCLWRIAEYPFVYGDPWQWPRLYQANKNTLHTPADPHLILPGQILVIPSLKGEKREGLWDPKKTYPPLATQSKTSGK